MEPNLAVSIYVRSSIKFLHFVPFGSPDNRMILKQISKGDNHYLKKQQPSWMVGGAVGHNFKRDTPRDHLCQVWLHLGLEIFNIFSLATVFCISRSSNFLFSSPDPKDHVRYCHHLASVVRPLTFSYFNLIWPSCFRGEDFFNISQSEKRIILGGHVYRPNGTKWRNFIEDLT
jgi:hypothetical protein